MGHYDAGSPHRRNRVFSSKIGPLLAAGFLLAATTAGQPDSEPDFYAPEAPLRSLIATALRHNPALSESLARYRAALQRVPQVKSLPDPMLSFNQFIRNVETRVGPQINSVSISQKLPWFGTLDLKGRIALQNASALYYEHRALEQALIADLKRAYYELSYLTRAEDVTRRERLLLERYEELSRSQYSQRRGPLRSIVRLQTEITRLDDRLLLLEQQQRSLQAHLDRQLGGDRDAPVDAPTELAVPAVTLDVADLYQLGRRHRPILMAEMERIESRRQSLELSRKKGWPEVTLSAGFVNVGERNDPAGLLMPPPDNGKNAFSISAGINLPLWRNRYDAGVLEATEQLIGSRQAYRRADNDMQFEIRDQVVRLQALREQMDLYDSLLLPQAEEALRSTESDFEIGRAGSVELLDSERFLLQLRLQRIRHEVDLLKSLATLEQALGTRFPR